MNEQNHKNRNPFSYLYTAPPAHGPMMTFECNDFDLIKLFIIVIPFQIVTKYLPESCGTTPLASTFNWNTSASIRYHELDAVRHQMNKNFTLQNLLKDSHPANESTPS